MSSKEKRVFRLVSLLITFSLVMILVIALGFTGNGDDEQEPTFTEKFQEDYSIYSLKLPDSLSFAGEEVPVEYFDIREALDRELLVNTYWQSHSLLLLKRANRYLPTIERILKENGIPKDFKYIPLIESELTNAMSPAGAVGFWQFLKGTAKDYNLEVTSQVDERYNIEKATEAACKFFHESHEKFGSWTLAAASFNFGRFALANQMERQSADSYYNLILNDETARYIFRILSMKLIVSNPEKYGFNIHKEDLYYPIPSYKVKVDTAVKDFADFAKRFSINYKLLKIMNPWLRENYLKNSHGKTYHIEIPEKGYRNYRKLFSAEKQ